MSYRLGELQTGGVRDVVSYRLGELQTGRVTDWVSYRLGELQTGGVRDVVSYRLGELQTGRVTDWASYRLGELQTITKLLTGQLTAHPTVLCKMRGQGIHNSVSVVVLHPLISPSMTSCEIQSTQI